MLWTRLTCRRLSQTWLPSLMLRQVAYNLVFTTEWNVNQIKISSWKYEVNRQNNHCVIDIYNIHVLVAAASPPSSEPTPEQVIASLAAGAANTTNIDTALSVNGKNVGVVDGTTKQPSNARPGVAVVTPGTNGTPGDQNAPPAVNSSSKLMLAYSFVVLFFAVV